MADKRYNIWVPALNGAAGLDGTELMPIVQSGATVKTTLSTLANYFGNVKTVGGIAGFFPIWTDSTHLSVNSLLFSDGNGVAIGTQTPSHRFQIQQSVNLTPENLFKVSTFNNGISIFEIDVDASNFASVTANVYEKPFLINLVGSGGRFKLTSTGNADYFEFSPVAVGEFTFVTGSNPAIDINNPSSGVMNKYTAMLGTASGNTWYVAAERTDVGSSGTDVGIIYGKLIQKASFNNVNAVFYPAVFMGGNVGIGTLTPTALLEVAGQVKITGGTPGAGKVLTSDGAGLASWQPAGGLSSALNSGFTFIGNNSNVATAVALNQLNYKLTLIPNSTAVVITPGTDPTNRYTVLAYQQSSSSDNSYGDAFRIIAGNGRTKAGLKFFARGNSGTVSSVNTAPFAVTNGQQLTIKVDGGGIQTITFGGLIVSGAATADEISAQISAVLTGGQAWNQQAGNTDVVSMSSDTFGILSTIQVTGGSANTGLGFPLTVFAGTDGVALGDGQTGIQKAWVICHDKPNDLTSNNRHAHISIEVPDSTGAMQTRIGIEYDLDISRITISSAQLIVNENPLILSGSTGSNKELWFSFDNRGQQKSRLGLIRCEATTGDLKIIVVNDATVTDTLMIYKRLLSTVWMDSGFQRKQGSAVTRSTTLNPLIASGDTYSVTGAGTATYMKFDSHQTGCYLGFFFVSGQIVAHNGASPSPGVSLPFDLRDAVDYTVPAGGTFIEFYENGTFWKEVRRIEFSNTTGTGKVVYDTSPTLITPNIGVASATSLATSAASPFLMTNGQLVTVALTSQTVGGATLTIPDFANVSDTFIFATKAATLSNKTFVAPVLGAATGTSVAVTGALTSSSSTSAGIGYVTGAGGTVTQTTSRSTAVSITKLSGRITTDTTSLAALASATFTVTNTLVAIADTVILNIRSGQTNKQTMAYVSAVAGGSFDITINNMNATTAEVGAILLNFTVIKGTTT